MKTSLATAALTIMFLSAGAFAGGKPGNPLQVAPTPANVTVIEKNSAWPVPVRNQTDPCSFTRCIDV